MYVIGSAEQAEGLANGSLQKMKEIYEATKMLQSDLKKLEESFQDEGRAKIENVIRQIVIEINNHFDDITQLSSGLKEYAEVLRRN